MSDHWNVSQYERFKRERSQPARDLMAMVQPEPRMRILDLGCGTGELTSELFEGLECSSGLGIDRSAAMLAKAKSFAKPGLTFQQAEIPAFHAEEPFDLVFSNAVFQWLPDHDVLFEKVGKLVAPGGQLAVQIPANNDNPSQTVAWEVALTQPYSMDKRDLLTVLKPEEYACLLDEVGFDQITVRLNVYLHKLESSGEVVEWMKGSLLTGYEAEMSPELFARFVNDYQAALIAQIGDQRPYLFTFKRILMHARKRL